MEGRRLDFDYKKKRQGKVTEDEIKQALEKFDDSKEVAEQSMFNLLESDVSSVAWPVLALVHNPFHASVEFHFTFICPNFQRVFPLHLSFYSEVITHSKSQDSFVFIDQFILHNGYVYMVNSLFTTSNQSKNLVYDMGKHFISPVYMILATI